MKRRSAAAIAAALVVGLGLGEAQASQAADVARMAAGDVRETSAPLAPETRLARETSTRPAASRREATRVERAPETQTARPELVQGDGMFETASLEVSGIRGAYRLVRYDVINVNVIGFPGGLGYGSDGNYTIGPDGRVAIPYVGNVDLAGLTVEEATELLRTGLSEYIQDPQVIVAIRSYGARKVYVMGEVQKPGIQELSVDRMNAYAALTSAGSWTSHGRSTKIQVVRARDGVMYYKELNMKKYIKNHDITQNVVLEDGDIVYVPPTNGIIWSEDVMPYVSAWALFRTLTKD